jgi:hypothetical protein
MEEFGRAKAQDAGSLSPSPPRWKGVQAFGPVCQLNERCIELLCNVAASESSESALRIVIEHRAHWLSLGLDARQRLARMPFVMVDAQFKNEPWWGQVAQSKAHAIEATEPMSNGLPREASEHLMHETMMFAWQMVRWDRTVALLSFSMLPSVAEIIAGLSPQQLRALSSQDCHAVRIRWDDDLQLWRDLLLAAQAGNLEKLGELHLHAKLLLCSELVQIRPK